ncbi:MAG: aldose epimerase family protein [Christensenellales bacterium]|jgi:aldose 1-epimerase
MITRLFGGTYKDKDYSVYEVTAGKYSMTVTNIGCAIMTFNAPGKDGNVSDVVLGYDSVEEYIDNPKYFGAVIGRVGNRIRNSRFVLDGKEYSVTPTSGDGTSLHGGVYGFDTKAFSTSVGLHEGKEALIFSYMSPDGEEGYPGNLNLTVIYSLGEDGSLLIKYIATTDKPTLCNITNHSFFNLKGHDGGEITDHHVQINADWFTPVDSTLNTDGQIISVKGTALDFTTMTRLGDRIDADEEPLRLAGGYDHNYVINVENPGEVIKIAEVYEPASGRAMEVFSDSAGVQLYSGNFISGTKGKLGAVYEKRDALCFETQYFPGAGSYAHFPSCRLDPGQVYCKTTIYKFGVK